LYDRTGSELFEKITDLPEYYLTRTEQALLEQRGSEIAEAAGKNAMLIEFGSGSSTKTRLLIRALLDRQSQLRYAPIDISHDFLCESAECLLNDFNDLSIEALGAEYFDAIASLPSHDGPRLLLFLGSNIGNLSHTEAVDFLSRVRKQMNEQDRLLLGVDLAKAKEIIEPAYNDSQGVTAAFNRNLLSRINRELDANFKPEAFAHRAIYDEVETRIEMQLVSQGDQRVCIDGIPAAYHFKDGEAIHTEWSHKYTIDRFSTLAAQAGLTLDRYWTDDNHWFGTIMLRVSG
jgi:dimethylhistidine N-methyltransferase